MKDFETIKLICEENSKVSSKVIDEFLIYYAAGRNKIEQEMNQKFAVYKHITSKFPNELINRLKAQYIAHKVFRQDGFINNYLDHSALKNLPNKERNYLKSQAYFDENKKIILLTSMTDRGFRALSEGLNEYGFDFFVDPFPVLCERHPKVR